MNVGALGLCQSFGGLRFLSSVLFYTIHYAKRWILSIESKNQPVHKKYFVLSLFLYTQDAIVHLVI